MEVIRFGLLGLATGAVYAMLAQGLVLVYRGSGLLNFSQGAFAMVGAYSYYEVTVRHGQSKWLGLFVAVVISAAAGALFHLVVLRQMRHASPLSRVIATLGFTVVLQAAAFLRYGQNPLSVPGLLSTRTVHVISHQLVLGVDDIEIFVIGALLTVVLTIVYRLTSIGRVTTAVAENQLAASSLGHSPDVVASFNWALGSALAGLGGVLIAPIIFLEPTQLVLLVLPAMAAALIGKFASFPITFGVALGIGVVESEISRYVTSPGWPTAVPFLVVIVLLVIRGQALPLRSFVLERLPAVGTGRIRPVPVALVFLVVAALSLHAGSDWATSMASTFAFAIICLSIVVITGYGGQLSLAQGVLAGVGALAAAKLAPHMPFILALVLAAAITAVVGAVVGIPALRTRGVTLAIATLGLGAAISAVVLGNQSYTGGVSGIEVPTPHIFGWNIDPFAHTNRYAFFSLVVLLLLSLAVANLRRGPTGRRLVAVRSNERAAASLGVSGAWSKTYAFVLGAAIAAVGGVLLAFLQSSVEVSQTDTFTVFTCILLVGVTVAGGVGSVGGALLGSTLLTGGIASKLFGGWSEFDEYLPLIGGVLLIAVLIFGPDGVFEMNRRLLEPVTARLEGAGSRLHRARKRPETVRRSPAAAEKVVAKAMVVRGLTVDFGGVRALDHVTLEVRPGEVHGLIGPNGAGKTTLIDAISGFVRVREGTTDLGDRPLDGLSPTARAGHGLCRSFQSLELFDDLTVLENLAVASEHASWTRWVLDLVRPSPVVLGAAALDALHQFDLVDLVDRKPGQISFGQRKTVAIARAVATSPSVLLLDEPAAGLNDQEADELATLIRHLARDWGIGVLLVEHKVDMIMSISDRVTVLDHGRVLTSGTPGEVQADDRVITAYLGTPASVSDEAAPGAVGSADLSEPTDVSGASVV
jgi:ABC-type branched-subunit amino acid transport system ATPase component/ABC-type branched-subunit amino acid transport system permease subunit